MKKILLDLFQKSIRLLIKASFEKSLVFLILGFALLGVTLQASELPTFFKGRVRPVDAYARLWLYDIYHQQEIKSKHRENFQPSNVQDLLWQLNFLGHTQWDQAPLFWIHYADLKELLHLNPSQDHFSYQQLHQAFYEKQITQLSLAKTLVAYSFIKAYLNPFNRARAEKLELSDLSEGLWARWQGNHIIVSAIPASSSTDSVWSVLQPGMIVLSNARDELYTYENKTRQIVEEALNLLNHLQQFAKIRSSNASDPMISYLHELQLQKLTPKEIDFMLENQFPLVKRLNDSGVLFKVLPGKNRQGDWYPLNALNLKTYDPIHNQLIPISNFTLYSDLTFEKIRKAYKTLELDITPQNLEELKILLDESYESLAGTPYKWAAGKTLHYPSLTQLEAESFYYHYPLAEIAILFYALALLTLIIFRGFSPVFSVVFLIIAYLCHTLILVLRCYILQRPPVSNMFETVIYVPWVAVFFSLCLWFWKRSRITLIASSFSALALLILIRLTNVNSSLENVQAVLDSQYWLTIHVLMIVASYGAFILAGLMGHFYLLLLLRDDKETPALKLCASTLLQTLYIGVALLIPGTILGGVWAAESWGRFWDWDPKESWAFISSCLYLVTIHAYRYKIISNFGLALSSIAGLMTISFTWYGVNYILGTGLHSYGFGSGGEMYYYAYLLVEIAIMGIALFAYQTRLKQSSLN